MALNPAITPTFIKRRDKPLEVDLVAEENDANLDKLEAALQAVAAVLSALLSSGPGGVGAVISVNGDTGEITISPATIGAATAAQGVKADTAVQPDAMAAAIGSAVDAVSPASIGAATSAQGDLADTAVQADAMTAAITAAIAAAAAAYATSAQGELADTAVQPDAMAAAIAAAIGGGGALFKTLEEIRVLAVAGALSDTTDYRVKDTDLTATRLAPKVAQISGPSLQHPYLLIDRLEAGRARDAVVPQYIIKARL